MSNPANPFGQVIHSYTRAQAIRDGVLVDLTLIPQVAKLWSYHIACTSSVWAIIVDSGEDPAFACHMIAVKVHMLSKIPKGEPADSIVFTVPLGTKLHEFRLHVGPGDAGEPVITLMLPHED